MMHSTRPAGRDWPVLLAFTVALALPGCGGGSSGGTAGTVPPAPAPPPPPPRPAGPSGLDSRPANLTCVAPERPTPGALVAVTNPYPNLSFSQPTKLLLEPVDDPRWFVLEKPGRLVVFDPDGPGAISPYLDLSGVVRSNSEGGLLGMAFHPDYPATSEIFLSYTVDHSGPAMRSIVSRFVLDDVDAPGPGTTEEVIIRIDQDFDNHNGGDIAFGPDGYLYIGLGDGGSGGDPNNRAQDTTTLLGSMLRIDVTGPAAGPYAIPDDNPFAGNPLCGPTGANAADCPEIYAWGLRNPWRWSFDPPTGALWLADVGQGAWEEVDLIERGGNYGWRCREGAHDYNTAGCGTGFVEPVAEYSHQVGNSITGGRVYRGSAIPGLSGYYVFADYGSGRIWALRPDGLGGYVNDELVDTNFGPTSFAADQDGELYFTDINNGRIRALSPGSPGTPDTIPALLSATGCVDPADITRPYPGLVPYDVNAPFWADGAEKERYLGVPDGTTIDVAPDGDFEFPPGAVIVKHFRLDGALVETRHLVRHPDGVWAGYTYEWNAQQTEATRVQGGKVASIGGQDWIFPSEGQCMECHTSAAGFSLGAEMAQLEKDLTYAATGRTANQLDTLAGIGMLTSALPGGIVPLADPADAGAGLGDRARAYLHTNCAQCHRPGGPTPSTMDLRYTTPLESTNACNVPPLLGSLGNPAALLIAPGAPADSLLIERATRRDVHGMPPLGSARVDTDGVALLTEWINGLADCH